MQPGRPAVFFDKDGTLVVDVPYNVDCAKIQLAPGALEAAALLHAAGYVLVVVSNQSGVARGLFPVEAIHGVEQHLRSLLAERSIPLAGFYFCPHLLEGSVSEYACRCDCRKPSPGMLLRAAEDLNLDLEQSWLIGDILDDIEAGRRAGCRTVLLDVGSETQWQRSPLREPHAVVEDLRQAALHILAHDGAVPPHRPQRSLHHA